MSTGAGLTATVPVLPATVTADVVSAMSALFEGDGDDDAVNHSENETASATCRTLRSINAYGVGAAEGAAASEQDGTGSGAMVPDTSSRSWAASSMMGDGDEDDGSASMSNRTDTFSTDASPLRLHPVLDHLLLPEVLLAEVMAYAGPAGTAKLRNFPLFRVRMARLTLADLVQTGLPFGRIDGVGCGGDESPEAATNGFVGGHPSEEAIGALRACLLEPQHECGRTPTVTKKGLVSAGRGGGQVLLRKRPDGELNDGRLSDLGMLALARCPLASERCLRNIVRHLERDKQRRACFGASASWASALSARRISLAVAVNPAASEGVLDALHEYNRGRAAPFGSLSECLSEAYDDSVPVAIAGNINTSPRLLRVLASSGSDTVRAAAAGNDRTPADVLADLVMNDESTLVLTAAGRNPRTPEQSLLALSMYNRTEAREAVAGNPRTPLIALQALASSDDTQVRMALSRNPCLPPDVLCDLSTDELWTVRRNVAQHPHTEPGVLGGLLLADGSPHVRLAAAFNSNIEPEEAAALLREDDPGDAPIVAVMSHDPAVLDRLVRQSAAAMATSDDGTVRRNVAGNVFASAETLALLSRSPDAAVRTIVALNPSALPSLLQDLLFRDPHPHVQAVAVRNPSTPPECLLRLVEAERPILEHLDEEVVEAISVDVKAPAMCLAALHRQLVLDAPFEPTRLRLLECLAANPRSPPHVLASLASSEFSEVRAAVVSNRKLHIYPLRKLASDRDHAVRCCVAGNELLQRVADHLSCLIPP